METCEVFRLELPAAYKYLSVLGVCIEEIFKQLQIADREKTAYDVQLAACEACTNIVRHAYGQAGGRIAATLTISICPAQFIVETHDDADVSFDPSTVSDPDLDDLDGRGLFLIRQLMDQVIYCDRDGRIWQSSKGASFVEIDTQACKRQQSQNYWRMIKQL